MREILSDSKAPCLVFSSTGRLKQIRTGSDGCAEHSFPAQHLVPKLCTSYLADASKVAAHPVTEGHLVQFVDLPSTPGSEPEAVVGFNGPIGPWARGTEQAPLDERSVLSRLTTFQSDVAAALAWGNFAIRVRGSANVEALAEFHRAIQAGDVMLAAGSRMNGNPHGVALINLKALTADECKLLENDPGTYLRTSFAA